MGRHRSDDSDGERDRKSRKKKKRRARSRSSDDSESSRYSSSKVKKSKKRSRKSSRSRSRSSDRRRTSRKSRSRSGDRAERSGRGRSRSRSPEYRSRRRSRSRSRSPDRRHSPPSYSRSRRSRSRGRRSRSHSRDRRSRSRDRRDRRSRSQSNGRSSSRRISPDPDSHAATERKQLKSEDVEERLRLALKAAALADEQLRHSASTDLRLGASTELTGSLSVLDKADFADSVAEIEAGSFVPAAFSSSRSTKVKEEPDLRSSHDDAIFGSLSVTGFTLKPDPDMKPVDLDADSIMHPSLYCNPDEKMDRWVQRLAQLRKRRLEGDAM